MKLVWLCLMPVIFVGCALVGVPASNDAKVKLQQGVVLNNQQGRSQGAIVLFNQAIELARKDNDKVTEAIAEFYIGEIYKAPSQKSQNIRNPEKALTHYAKAIPIYNEIKFYKSVSFVNWNATGAQIALNKSSKEICKHLIESKKYAEKPGSDPKDTLAHLYNDGKLLQAIKDEIKKEKCI